MHLQEDARDKMDKTGVIIGGQVDELVQPAATDSTLGLIHLG